MLTLAADETHRSISRTEPIPLVTPFNCYLYDLVLVSSSADILTQARNMFSRNSHWRFLFEVQVAPPRPYIH